VEVLAVAAAVIAVAAAAQAAAVVVLPVAAVVVDKSEKKKMMKKIVLLCIVFLLSGNISLFAQGNEIDAYTLSTTDLGGTARSMAMGGAFGALGGDLSVIGNNPAGLGIYRSSEISGTLDFSTVKTSTNWMGTTIERDKMRFSPNNFAFSVYFPTSSDGVRNWSFGFSYNRLKNFKRTYAMSAKGQTYSMADFTAWHASNAFGYGNGMTIDELTYTDRYDPYNNSNLSGKWLPILGFESGMYDHFAGRQNEYQSAFGWDRNGQWLIDSPTQSSLIVNENGYMDEYNIGLGFNISNVLYLGTSISVTDIDYRYSSFYDDEFYNINDKDDYLYMENRLNTKGTAMSVNLGAILNLQVLRLGLAYNSPRFYDMTDYFSAFAGTEIHGYEIPKMDTETPDDSYSEYRFRTPHKWIFSSAIVLGQFAIFSADYEMMNYKMMRFADRNDNAEFPTNDFIKEDYTYSHTLKLGTEVKVTPRFALRAGYMMQSSPMREVLVKNDVEVLPAGTIPHFSTTSKPTHYYTTGLGYRFTPNFYMDLALIYRTNNAFAYAFSNTYSDRATVDIYTDPAKLKNKTTRFALTLGYKF